MNPDGYQANVCAWRHAIECAAWEGRLTLAATVTNVLVISVDHYLLTALESKRYGRPLALDAVVRESVRNHHLVPLATFLSRRHNICHRSWRGLPWAMAGWIAQTLRQFDWLGTHVASIMCGLLILGLIHGSGANWIPYMYGLILTSAFCLVAIVFIVAQKLGLIDAPQMANLPTTGQFVALANVTKATSTILESLASASSCFELTYTRKHFEKAFASVVVPGRLLSSLDIEVLLKFMSRDRNVVEYDGRIIKFKLANNGPGSNTKLTAEDSAIASLKELIESLRTQTERVSSRLQGLTESAKMNVARGDTIAARAALRSRRLSQDVLETRLATLNQLEQVAAKIEQASDQAQLIHVLDMSSGILKSLNAKVGNVGRVEQVMERLQEQMFEVDEVGTILTADAAASTMDPSIDDEIDRLTTEDVQSDVANDISGSHDIVDLESRLKAITSTPREIVDMHKDIETLNVVDKSQETQQTDVGMRLRTPLVE
jgi:charged multivesicular body protein 7